MHANKKSNGVHRHNRRGVVGIESAIVLIAFVIVAAALAFVVLNMGFSTTQKAKTTITSGLGEASSAIEIAGQVTGQGNTTAQKISAYGIPIKLAAGGSSIDIGSTKTAIKYFSKSVSYDNIYEGAMSNTTFSSIDDAIQQAFDEGKITGNLPGENSGPTDTVATIYFTTNVNNNDIIDAGEQAVILIVFKNADRPAALDIVNTELIVSSGAPLTVQRNVPTITDTVLNLG